MTLDQELRAALGLEADLRTPPAPDVVGLIHGGRVRRRRRTVARLAVAAFTTVLVGAGAVGVVSLDPRAGSDVATPSSPSPTPLETLSDDGRATLDPGTYRMYVGRDPAGAWVVADVTVDGPHWKHGDFPVVSDQHEGLYAGFGVYQALALAAGDGCETGPTVGAARDPDRLAAQLAALPRSTVLQAPERVRVLGLPSVHLRLRVDVDCPGFYRVAHSTGGTRGITYVPSGATAPNVVIDFWVLEVDGVLVVVDEWRSVDTPPDVVAQAHEARRSITFAGEG